MKNRFEIFKDIEKNLTYQSIRFNNKQVTSIHEQKIFDPFQSQYHQISDEIVKNLIDQFFPRLFCQQKWKDITFFTKAMKEQDFYKKIRAIVSMHLSLENHLKDFQQKQIEKSKLQNLNPHCVEEINNKKMTRAALAKRNLLTQEQLRKDQIFVRLTPKNQQCLQWMLCNRKFPRIECKLSCNQHIEYLINYLSNKWLPGKGHNRIVLYPDVSSYLKNNLLAKQRQKILKEPLNNYFMFTDVMAGNFFHNKGSGIGQNGILNLHYDIIQKKKNSNQPQSVSELSIFDEKDFYEKNIASHPQPNADLSFEAGKKLISLDEMSNSIKKSSFHEKQQKVQNFTQLNITNFKLNEPKIMLLRNSKSEQINNLISVQSNHFVSNQSNLLSLNQELFHDEESMFKSIGYCPFSTGGIQNNLDYKKHDFSLISINSNSFIEMQPINLIKHSPKQQQPSQFEENKLLQQTKEKKLIYQNRPEEKQEANLKQIQFQSTEISPSPEFLKTQKKSTYQTPLSESFIKKQEKEKQNKKFDQQICENLNSDQQLKKDLKDLLDLRNVINLLELVREFKDQPGGNEQIPHKSRLKDIKTINIKKRATV